MNLFQCNLSSNNMFISYTCYQNSFFTRLFLKLKVKNTNNSVKYKFIPILNHSILNFICYMFKPHYDTPTPYFLYCLLSISETFYCLELYLVIWHCIIDDYTILNVCCCFEVTKEIFTTSFPVARVVHDQSYRHSFLTL